MDPLNVEKIPIVELFVTHEESVYVTLKALTDGLVETLLAFVLATCIEVHFFLSHSAICCTIDLPRYTPTKVSHGGERCSAHSCSNGKVAGWGRGVSGNQ